MEEKEIWKPLFEENIKKDLGRLDGVFLVSNLGRIKDGLNDKILNPSIWEDYQVVTLYHNFKDITGISEICTKTLSVHRIVAGVFVPNPDNLQYVNHKDENKLNNRADNLEWCDPKYNRQYGTGSKRMVETKKKNGSIQKIHQLTLDGEYIAEYETTKIASLETGVSVSAIYQCCRRFCKQMKGYVFLFDKDYKFLKNDDRSVDVELLRNNSAFRIKLSEKRGGLSYKEIKSPS
ncbi:HNH endonuclease [Bariatricus sp. SGI.019]|uniref:HNH endonuclease n=1 Tax=Bariatricus sp. SGI.019 TaxID=3420548 RepID=UPI003CFF7C56